MYQVTENTAKIMRVWEELGGPSYITLDDCGKLCKYEMSATEFGEVPTWPRKDDAKHGIHYVLPARLAPRPRGRGF